MSGITWLASYPKSGNTWLRVFLANLRAGGDAAADINRLGTAQFSDRELLDRLVGWESADLSPAEIEALRLPAQRALAAQPGEAWLKTHEALADAATGRARFAPEATHATLYVVRNPLDVAVSLSHYWNADLATAIAFLNDPAATLPSGPHEWQAAQWLGDWSTHVASWSDAPGMNVTVLRYEDMIAAPRETFTRAARGAGLTATDAEIARAVAHSRFEALQAQEREKGFGERAGERAFFRAGRTGEGREQLSAAQVAAIVQRHGAMMRRFGYLDAAPAER